MQAIGGAPSPYLRTRALKRQRRITAGGAGAAKAPQAELELSLANNQCPAGRPQPATVPEVPVQERQQQTAVLQQEGTEQQAAGLEQGLEQQAAGLRQEATEQQAAGLRQGLEQQAVAADGGSQHALVAAWQEYVCPGRADVWQLACPLMPAESMAIMHSSHPSVVFPSHYPNRLPSPLAMLPGILQSLPPMPELQAAVDAAGGLGPFLAQRQAVAAAAAAAAADTAAGVPEQLQQPLPQPHPSAAEADAAAAEEQAEEEPEGSSGGCPVWCSCSDCCYSDDCYYSSSADSQKVQPGKRICWRYALSVADPVRRNLFASLQQAKEGAPPPQRPPSTRTRRQPRRLQ